MSANPTICLIPPRTPTTELVNQEDLSRIPSKFAVLSRIDPSVSAMSFSPGASLTPTSTGISESLRPLTTLNAANDPSRPPSPVTIGTYTPLHYRKSDKYKHIFAIHADQKTSTLSHDAAETPSFIGFRNLMVLVLIVGNLRLVIENYMKYGVLISLAGGEYRRDDVRYGVMLYILIPAHLFVGYVIELLASQHARKALAESRKFKDENGKPVKGPQPEAKAAWKLIALGHTINATVSLGFTSWVIYYHIHHPLIGTLCQFHVVIVWLKQLSYAFTNRDLRDAYLTNSPVPEIYRACPYPKNITVSNLCYFWWAPTLVYQPVYPRTANIRWNFFFKRVGETVALSIAIWFLSQQYAVPTLRNSLEALGTLNIPVILERLMKLSTVSLVIWLAGFFALFHSFLNALAEILRFGDREFYADWWNSSSVGTYWKLWNKPVYHFMRRHVYAPLQARGWSASAASMMVFTLSAILHEVLVGIPTHNIIGVAFAGMMFQIPLVYLTVPLEKMRGSASVLGNCVFWVSFVLVGQPIAALLYYFTWQVKYGAGAAGVGK